MAVDVSPGSIPICWQTFSGTRCLTSQSAPVPRSESQDHWSLPLRHRTRPDEGYSAGGIHALGCPPTHPALPRRPPGQGDRLRRANKNPGPPRGPGRANRAACRSADDTANPRAPRDRHSQACVRHIHRLSPSYDDPDRESRVLLMLPGRSRTALKGCIT
jgi:hypothetical protein